MTTTDDNAIAWLKTTWESMAPYRRAIPDEQTGTLLLWEIQGGCCCTCWPRVECPDRVLDHDHATGMVRGWLCRSCNNLEGHAPGPLWDAYHLYAPGNGLFIRYFNGPHSEWAGITDPFLRHRAFLSLAEYRRAAPFLPAVMVPDAALRLFVHDSQSDFDIGREMATLLE